MLSWKQVFLFSVLKRYCDVTLKIHTLEYIMSTIYLISLTLFMQFKKGSFINLIEWLLGGDSLIGTKDL